MCGIFSRDAVADHLEEALRRQEYRGDESASVATLKEDPLTVCPTAGKLRPLEQKLANRPFKEHIGMDLPRSATHKKPSERNASRTVVLMGADVDQPRKLAKSLAVE